MLPVLVSIVVLAACGGADVYGHWLEHSMFVMVDDSVAVSFGDSPGTNPTLVGGAVWRGDVVGVDTGTRVRIASDASIEIDDFARPDVDVAFTGIKDAGGRARADLRWEDIPLVQGGFSPGMRRVRLKAGSTEPTTRKRAESSNGTD